MHPHKKCTQFTGIKRLTVTAVIVIQHGDDPKRHHVDSLLKNVVYSVVELLNLDCYKVQCHV